MHNNDVNNFIPSDLGGIRVTEIGDNSTIENCPFVWGVLISIRCFAGNQIGQLFIGNGGQIWWRNKDGAADW